MAASMEEDDFGTIGLPGGAAQDFMKSLKSPKAADVPAPLELPSAVPPSKPRPPAAAGQNASGRRPPPPPASDEFHGDAYRTIPPAGGARPPRPTPIPAEPKRTDGPRPKTNSPVAGPPVASRGGKPDRRQETPPAPLEESEDNWPENFFTAPLPGKVNPSKPAPPPEPVFDDDQPNPWEDSGARPLISPQGKLPAQPSTAVDDEDASSETPARFPGSSVSDHFLDAISRSHKHAIEMSDEQRELADDTGRTIGIHRPTNVVSKSILQFNNLKEPKWLDLGEVRRPGQTLGRRNFANWDPNPEGLAEEHLKLTYQGDDLFIEPLPSLNGVYRRLKPNQRVELEPDTRFRIGRHVLVYRRPGPPPQIVPKVSGENEVFQSRVLSPLGFIDLIGPDGEPYLTFPMTRGDTPGTRIGRAGADCDIDLAGDDLASRRHARLVLIDGHCMLEDLGSTNGTFIILKGRVPMRRGIAGKPDSLDEFLIGQYGIRVVELRPSALAGPGLDPLHTQARY